MVYYSKYGITGTLGPIPIHRPSYASVLRPFGNNRSLGRVEGWWNSSPGTRTVHILGWSDHSPDRDYSRRIRVSITLYGGISLNGTGIFFFVLSFFHRVVLSFSTDLRLRGVQFKHGKVEWNSFHFSDDATRRLIYSFKETKWILFRNLFTECFMFENPSLQFVTDRKGR